MPHQRFRYAASLVAKALSFSPITGIFGLRQTGKTTLAASIDGDYATLDLGHELEAATEDPQNFLSNRSSPFIIDECQLSPPLFPALKEAVRKNQRPGQFLLTGSVRFTSRKKIRESLTGRMIMIELRPMTISEAAQKQLSDGCLRLLSTRNPNLDELFPKRSWQSEAQISRSLLKGGLPGICFVREESILKQKFESLIDLILDRDLRLLHDTQVPLPTLRLFLRELAHFQGKSLEVSELSRRTRLSRDTVRILIRACESMYLIRYYPSDEFSSKPWLYFEDQGMQQHLNPRKSTSPWDEPVDTQLRLIHANVLPQFFYRPDSIPRVTRYETRGGASVPIVITTDDGALGFIPSPFSRPSTSAYASTRSFLKSQPRSKVILVVSGEAAPKRVDNRVCMIPVRRLL